MPEVPVSTAEDVDKAVKAARAAFPAWRKLSQDERAAYIMKLHDAVKANSDGFKDILVRESGKPVGTAAIELAKTLEYFEKVSKLRLNDEVVLDDDEKTATVRYVPLGVACAIVPWNWPLLLGTGKIVSALLAGECGVRYIRNLAKLLERQYTYCQTIAIHALQCPQAWRARHRHLPAGRAASSVRWR